MADLIPLAELLAEIDREIKRVPACTATLQRARSIAMTIPTIDAEPVVRCHLCDSWEPFGCKQERGACEEWSDYEHGITRYTGRDDFCSSGKRKAEHEDFAVKRMDADAPERAEGGGAE